MIVLSGLITFCSSPQNNFFQFKRDQNEKGKVFQFKLTVHSKVRRPKIIVAKFQQSYGFLFQKNPEKLLFFRVFSN